ncbi:hypothetical protein [Streptomyces sp. WAC01280]|uniref:hypothetical protein n=1 Tax=Streptomyces sp. WAC01280 TaxID=2487424 RepID=UPI000F779779|nr:hypothetical protein [Streptomyces sp. WAC01280]RSS50880.1 hypothetical protein EF909_36195 [Streptomyces sp. WAC01280]
MAPAPLRQRTALVETVTTTLAATARAAAVSAVTATAALGLTAPALATPATVATREAPAPKAAPAPGPLAPAGAAGPLAPAALAAPAAPASAAPAPNAPDAPAAPQAPAAPRIPAPDPPTLSCGAAPDGGFPLAARIHGGPADYPAGGPLQAWKLDLTNTTDAPCTGVHPVLVLTDRDRALRAGQIRFEFYDEGSARWRPVAFEVTEEAENVGVFTGFGGFAVPAGKTLTVPVRLAFREDTAPDEVVVSAAVVQRRGEDGDWVGASDDYRLTVGPAAPEESGTPEPTATATPADPPASTAPATKDPRDPKDPKSGTATVPEPELAHTGRQSDREALLLAPFAAALVLLGITLIRTARRTVRRAAHHPRHPRHS